VSNSQGKIVHVSQVSVVRSGLTILSDVDCELAAGESVFLVGPNGAGKTTLVKCLSGVLEPEQGEVRLLGRAMQNYTAKTRAAILSLVPQNFQPAMQISVFDFLRASLYPLRGSERNLETRIPEILERLALGSKSRSLLSELSGGERQRVLLASALILRPKVLFLDEPTNHLDPRFQMELYALLLELQNDLQFTMVWVTHDLSLAAQIPARVIAMKNAEIVFDGTSRSFFESDVLQALFDTPFRELHFVEGSAKERRFLPSGSGYAIN
jgi:iron complex transport system ATP-binding protein